MKENYQWYEGDIGEGIGCCLMALGIAIIAIGGAIAINILFG